MLAAILSIIDAIGSSGVVAVIAVWLGWRLGASTQRTQRRLDALDRRFEALSEIMAVADNVPSDMSYDEFVEQLETDDFRRNMSGRLVRLSGIRRERVGWLDPAIVDFIDDRLRPLYRSGGGEHDLPRDRAREFATVALELPELVARTESKLLGERKLLEEGRTRFWPWIAQRSAKKLPRA